MSITRLKSKFEEVKKRNDRPYAFIAYSMAHDPDMPKSVKLLKSLVKSGADIIELGMPFTDPVADGPVIQAASVRALSAGCKIKKIFNIIKEFRKDKDCANTPIILMGYYNPIQHYGLSKYAKKAKEAGADGFLIVDLPLEEDAEFSAICDTENLALIKLITPCTSKQRAKIIAKNSKGFIYYVSTKGITGKKDVIFNEAKENIEYLKSITKTPIAIGFGIKTHADVKICSSFADAVIVGSSIVEIWNEKNSLKATEKYIKNLIKV